MVKAAWKNTTGKIALHSNTAVRREFSTKPPPPMDMPRLPSHHRLCEAGSQGLDSLVCLPPRVLLHGTTAERSHSQTAWYWCAPWHPRTTPRYCLTSGHKRWCSSYAGRRGQSQSDTLFCVSACVPAAQRKTLPQKEQSAFRSCNHNCFFPFLSLSNSKAITENALKHRPVPTFKVLPFMLLYKSGSCILGFKTLPTSRPLNLLVRINA